MGMIDVVKWDAAPKVVAYHYPDCELNYKPQSIVTEPQITQHGGSVALAPMKAYDF